MYAVTIKTLARRDDTTTRYFSDVNAATEFAVRLRGRVEEVKPQALSDIDLEQALYCAQYPRTDEALLLEARREKVKRLTFDRDAEGLQALIAMLVFESLGSLYENGNLHTRPHGVSAYNADGLGVEIDIPLPHVGNVAD